MASRRFDIMRVLGIGRVTIHGRFFPQGTGVVVNANNKGVGFSVVRLVGGNPGRYQVSFTDKYVDLVSFTAGVQDSTIGNWDVLFGPYDPTPANPTILIATRHNGSLEDLVADPNSSVCFSAVFRNSSVNF